MWNSLEGEEEIGSMHLEQDLSIYKEKFICDAVIWEFGFVDEKCIDDTTYTLQLQMSTSIIIM